MNEKQYVPEDAIPWKEGWSQERADQVKEQGMRLAEFLEREGYDEKFILTVASALNAAEGQFNEFSLLLKKNGMKEEDLPAAREDLYSAYALFEKALITVKTKAGESR